MKKLLIILFYYISIGCTNTIISADNSAKRELSTEAKNVLDYLESVNGKYMLSGQQESNYQGMTTEIEYIYLNTGKYPAIHGFDIRTDVPDPVAESIKSWKERHQLIALSWHMGAPPLTDSYENSKQLAKISDVLEKGSPQNIDFMQKLAAMAARLQKLKDQKVPVLWRPFHEMNGGWFWWGPKQGSENDGRKFVQLWRLMYDYFTVEKKLDNLIWVWSGSFEINPSFYPGEEYADIIGTDTYHQWNYPRWTTEYQLLKNLSPAKMIALTENDAIPDPDEAKKTNTNWLWFLTWHTKSLRVNSVDHLKKIYNHEAVITADELPDLSEK